MSFFDDFLNAKVAPEDRAVLSKYPELKSSVEKMESDLGTYGRYAGQWLEWQQDNWDPDARTTKAEVKLRQELAEAQARLAGAPAAGASAAEINKLREEFSNKLHEAQVENQRHLNGMNAFWSRAATKMMPHQQEFGENFDPNSLLEFMQQNQPQYNARGEVVRPGKAWANDPDLAYNEMVSARRQEISAKRQKELDDKHAADIAAAEQRGRELAAREAAMGPGGMLPTDSTGGIAGITAQINKPAQVSDEEKARVSEAKLGDGSLALLGYEKYRRGDYPVQ